MRSIHLVLVAAFVSWDCVGSFVETTPLNSAPHPLSPRPPDSVEVYTSSPPVRPHVDVALLRASRSNYESTATPVMVQLLLKRASALGCDALFVSESSERTGNPDIFDPGSRALSGTCIAYLPESPGAPVAPPPRNVNAVVLLPATLGSSRRGESAPPNAPPAAVVDIVSTGSAHR